jgi:rhodanese-related sulfurtransferase
MSNRSKWRSLTGAGMVACALATGASAQHAGHSHPAAGPAAGSAAPAAEVAQPHVIGLADVRKQMDEGKKVVILDVRPGPQAEMIKDAQHAAFSDLEAWAKDVPKDTFIVTYCACGSEGSSKAAASKLQALGFTNVHALKGGIQGWKAAGLPVQPGT